MVGGVVAGPMGMWLADRIASNSALGKLRQTNWSSLSENQKQTTVPSALSLVTIMGAPPLRSCTWSPGWNEAIGISDVEQPLDGGGGCRRLPWRNLSMGSGRRGSG